MPEARPYDSLLTDYYRRRQVLARWTADAAQRTWRGVDAADIRDSWRERLHRLLQLLTAAQFTAARDGAAYAGEVVTATGTEPDPAGDVRPGALAGVASDGRSLETLLHAPAVIALARIAAGTPPPSAMLAGQGVLTRIFATQVTDAGRVATGIGLATDRAVTGYVRRVVLPACDRCIVLAGKYFRANTGFARHPRCDCVHVPVIGDEDWRKTAPDPRELFESMTTAQQDRAFSAANARAIRDGAGISELVNARQRGLRPAGVRTRRTTGGRPRVMPEQIYATAATRGQAVGLLRRHGYLT